MTTQHAKSNAGMNLVKYWNPAPIITHLVDEDERCGDGSTRTLCGKAIATGWESGDEHLEGEAAAIGDDQAICGCRACSRIARRIAKA